MVAPIAHHNGRTKSAPRPKVVNVSQNIFRSISQVYSVPSNGSVVQLEKPRILFSLGDHPKPAHEGHVKTGRPLGDGNVHLQAFVQG
jgi:hypothetical protein